MTEQNLKVKEASEKIKEILKNIRDTEGNDVLIGILRERGVEANVEESVKAVNNWTNP